MTAVVHRGLSLALALLAAGCGTPPPLRVMPCAAATAPVIRRDGDTATTTLSILTYNVEGLGWPARKGRGPSLDAIGRRLALLRAGGRAPDVVMFQEAFSGAAKNAVSATGYPAIAPGPRRTTRPPPSERTPLPGRPQLLRGELGVHLSGGGLAIASRYPVVATAMRAYGRRSCAGYDCLANKGIVLARIHMPGVPVPIDLYDTHMNARGASKVPLVRNRAAHARQAAEAAAFIDATHDRAAAMILGGDFNMRHSEPRWANFMPGRAMRLVHQVCADPASACDVRMSWDGDAPWMDTQDLHFFRDGATVAIRPVRVEAMFDGSPGGGPVLSDHDGFLVTYVLSWPADAPVRGGCG